MLRRCDFLEGNGDFRKDCLFYLFSGGKVIRELRLGMLEMEGILEILFLKWCDGLVCFMVRIMS